MATRGASQYDFDTFQLNRKGTDEQAVVRSRPRLEEGGKVIFDGDLCESPEFGPMVSGPVATKPSPGPGICISREMSDLVLPPPAISTTPHNGASPTFDRITRLAGSLYTPTPTARLALATSAHVVVAVAACGFVGSVGLIVGHGIFCAARNVDLGYASSMSAAIQAGVSGGALLGVPIGLTWSTAVYVLAAHCTVDEQEGPASGSLLSVQSAVILLLACTTFGATAGALGSSMVGSGRRAVGMLDAKHAAGAGALGLVILCVLMLGWMLACWEMGRIGQGVRKFREWRSRV